MRFVAIAQNKERREAPEAIPGIDRISIKSPLLRKEQRAFLWKTVVIMAELLYDYDRNRILRQRIQLVQERIEKLQNRIALYVRSEIYGF